MLISQVIFGPTVYTSSYNGMNSLDLLRLNAHKLQVSLPIVRREVAVSFQIIGGALAPQAGYKPNSSALDLSKGQSL